MVKDVKKAFEHYKTQYAGGVMNSPGSFTKLGRLAMQGVDLNAITQPVYECGFVYQDFTVEYAGDSFNFTYQRDPYPPERQQFGWD